MVTFRRKAGQDRLDPHNRARDVWVMDDLNDIARTAAHALDHARQIPPFSQTAAPLSRAEAYGVAARMRALRGGRRVGVKIGFTNRAIWPIYQVDAPIWGDVTQHSLIDAPDGAATVVLAPFCEPRIEPEIVLGLSAAPEPGMDLNALMGCIEWVAPGAEIVQSIYPGWRFHSSDTIIAQGLHGALVVGARRAATPDMLHSLPQAGLTLYRNEVEIEKGIGANALDGPVHALLHLVSEMATLPDQTPLQAGDLITTGTLTDAWPVQPAETWQAEFGAPLESTLAVHFT